MSEWIKVLARLPPRDEIVETKIDDPAGGCRKVQLLRRRGSLWFVADNSMHVYYCPTHWRPVSQEQLAAFKEQQIAAAKAQLAKAEAL